MLVADDRAVDPHAALIHHAHRFGGRGTEIGLFEQLGDRQRCAGQAQFANVIRDPAFGAIDKIRQRIFRRLFAVEAGALQFQDCH